MPFFYGIAQTWRQQMSRVRHLFAREAMLFIVRVSFAFHTRVGVLC